MDLTNMDLSEGQIFIRSGFSREILMMTDSCVLVKTIGNPVNMVSGRPPKSGVIWKSSFLKWLNNNASLPGMEIKTIKIQLTV